MASVDLQKLANTPGYGAAKTEIMKAGLWDEYAGQAEREYFVRVEYSIRQEDEETVLVRARCEAEAIELAERKVRDGYSFEIDIEHSEVTP